MLSFLFNKLKIRKDRNILETYNSYNVTLEINLIKAHIVTLFILGLERAISVIFRISIILGLLVSSHCPLIYP
jgi:hypothetical protein